MEERVHVRSRAEVDVDVDARALSNSLFLSFSHLTGHSYLPNPTPIHLSRTPHILLHQPPYSFVYLAPKNGI
jgi:hypothetical protein